MERTEIVSQILAILEDVAEISPDDVNENSVLMDDLDLSAGSAGEPLLPPDTCLMEIKIPGTTPLWLARGLSENAIFPTHFSKYGAAYQTMQREEKPIRFNEKGEIYCA